MNKLQFRATDIIANVEIPDVSIHHDGYIFFRKEYLKKLYKGKDISHIDNCDAFEHAWLKQDKCTIDQVVHDDSGNEFLIRLYR